MGGTPPRIEGSAGSAPHAPQTAILAATGACAAEAGAVRSQDSFTKLSKMAAEFYRKMGGYRGLSASGLNAVFGPLVDTAPADGKKRGRAHMWQRGRVHSWRPEVVAFFAGLAIEAGREDGRPVFSFIKHAPGIGEIEAETIEMGRSFVTDARSAGEVADGFRAFTATLRQFDGGVGVMVAGVTVPSLDTGDAKGAPPAALSHKIISWMRRRLGEDVLLITDDANSPSFRSYLDKIAEKRPNDPGERKVQRLADLLYHSVKADMDVILFCEGEYPDKLVIQFQTAGRRLIESGKLKRRDLIPSVRRILAAKKAMYPGNPRLADVDALIAKMTNDQLLAQKLLLMAHDYDGNLEASSSRAIDMGVGGLSSEDVQQKRMAIREIADRKTAEGRIPAFIADNSPQELPGYDNRASSAELGTWSLIRKFTAAYDRFFPDGASNCFFSVMGSDVTTGGR